MLDEGQKLEAERGLIWDHKVRKQKKHTELLTDQTQLKQRLQQAYWLEKPHVTGSEHHWRFDWIINGNSLQVNPVIQ